MKTAQFKNQKGFTLIELLVVISIIAVLAVVVFVALNPAKRIIEAKNARRQTDVDSILTAIHESIVDNKGTLPTNLPAAGQERMLGSGTAVDCAVAVGTNGCTVPADTACADLMTGGQNLTTYLQSMPIDPTAGTTWTAVRTGYSVAQATGGIITIRACGKEVPTGETVPNISASR